MGELKYSGDVALLPTIINRIVGNSLDVAHRCEFMFIEHR